MNISLKSAVAAILLASAFGVSSQAQALVIIDSFGDAVGLGTTVVDTTVTAGASSNGAGEALIFTQLFNVNRTLQVESIGVNGSANIISNANGLSDYLEINNSITSNGVASVFYTFDNEDFTGFGNALILDVLAIDLNDQVEMVINGTSTSGFQAFAGPGQFYALFSSFSDPGQFTAVTSITLNFRGVAGWDGGFDNFRIDTPPPPPPPQNTPEPATIALMGLGLAGFAAARKKKQA